jgi:Transcriptional regulator, AbiEi antitoxin
LIQAGITPSRIRNMVRQGILTRLDQGVYARTETATRLTGSERGERMLRLAAATALAGPAAVASHSDAALVHRLRLINRPAAPVTITVPRSSPVTVKRADVTLHRSSLPPGHVSRSSVIPVTSVARTVVDVARTTSFMSGVATADSALHERKTTKARLLAIAAACAGWPGIERAREVIAFSDHRSESAFESISRVAFRDAGLPAPELQVWVGSATRRIGRADFLWREHRTIGEPTARSSTRNPGRAREQLRRDADLREAGFEVVHFTWREVVATPELVASAIRTAFRRSAALRSAARPGG